MATNGSVDAKDSTPSAISGNPSTTSLCSSSGIKQADAKTSEICTDSASAQRLLVAFTDAMRERLGSNLVGLYLHGSLAMDSYVPGLSDVDVLAVIEEQLSTEQYDAELRALLVWSAKFAPKGIEISYLVRRTFSPQRAAWPFALHYGEDHRAKVERFFEGKSERPMPCDGDADLPGHIAVVRTRGRALFGPAPAVMFPAVPRKHYLASVSADLDDGMQHLARNPPYTILNLARSLRFLVDNKIGSKIEGGQWLQTYRYLPAEFAPAVVLAMEQQQGKAPKKLSAELERLASWLYDSVHAAAAASADSDGDAVI